MTWIFWHRLFDFGSACDECIVLSGQIHGLERLDIWFRGWIPWFGVSISMVKVVDGSMVGPYPTCEDAGPYHFLLTGDPIFKQHILWSSPWWPADMLRAARQCGGSWRRYTGARDVRQRPRTAGRLAHGVYQGWRATAARQR